jgi:hypothetical protein
MKNKELLNAAQLALILDISEKTVKKLAKENQLPCEYVNRRPQFKMNVLFNFFKQLEGGAACTN